MPRGDGDAASPRSRLWPALIALAITVIAVGITATTASAASTRAEWVTQVDPICQAGVVQEEAAAVPLARAIRRAKKHHAHVGSKRLGSKKLDRAFSRYFQQVVAIEHSVNDQIVTIPPAPDDVSLIQVWLRARERAARSREQTLLTGE